MTPAERAEAHELLIGARKLIETPERWTKGAYQDLREDGTRCFCLLGALKAAANEFEYDAVTLSAEAYARFYRLRGIVMASIFRSARDGYFPAHHYNDAPHRTHAEVLAVLDDAIERTKPCD